MTTSSGAPEALIELRVPGDKSISHRALMLASLAEGTSRIRGILDSADTRSTAGVLRALGVAVPELAAGAELAIEGKGLRGLRPPAQILDCGNSGTTARLMLGILAGHPFRAALDGDASLRSRPMRRVTGPLREMGAEFEELGAPDRLPLRVRGRELRPFAHEGVVASAQVKSAILLAGLVGGVPVSVREPLASRDHTERMLEAMGVTVRTEQIDDSGASTASVDPVAALQPLDADIPGDFSSAAFAIALGTLSARGPLRIRGVGVNPGRTGLLRVLERMGGRVRLVDERMQGGEPVADLVVFPASLGGTSVDAAEIPALIDEVPVLAILAARAEGETRIEGAAELRVKETDRIAALVTNLRAIGVEAEELEDGLVIRGSRESLAGPVQTYGDHRIAMAFGVLGVLPGAQMSIDAPEATEVSYPGFWTMIRAAAAALGER